MRVRSKLADVEFRFGSFERKKDHLIIHSAPEQSMPTRVQVSPDDVTAALVKGLASPGAWLYFAGFPFFLLRHRWRQRQGASRR